jgi:hypothetical protein
MFDTLLVEASTQAATPALKIAGRVQIEAAALATRRAQAYMEIPAILARCQTGQDLLTAQVMFWQRAQRQYAEGFEHLAASIQLANGNPAVSGSPRSARTVVQPVVPPARETAITLERQPAPTFASAKKPAPTSNQSRPHLRRSA